MNYSDFLAEWPNFVKQHGTSWCDFHRRWFTTDMCLLIVHYEELVENLEQQLKRIAEFLGVHFDQ